jgi:outer membrane protein, multidrug efflux system
MRRSSVQLAFLAMGFLLMTLLALGCAIRPPYSAPVVQPVALTQASAPAFAQQPYDPRWWQLFQDPVLDRLEAAALASNHDIRQAVARVDQARAIFRDVELDRYPVVEAGAAVDVREQAIPGFTTGPIRTNTYRAGLVAFWELDLFGGIRSAVRSARAEAQGLDASLEDVRVVVAAEVARNYFLLRGLQQQLAVAERSLTNQREAQRLTGVRRDAGVGEEQDVASASASVAAVEASIPPLRQALAIQRHRLAVLIGLRPGDLAEDLAPRAYAPLMTTLPLGATGDLLRRRPDVRAAERQLAAATAREGIAAADLYPRVTISGVLGFLAGRGNLFGQAASRQWAVTPALSWVGTDLGSARARLRGTEAATREVLARYEQTMLRAIEETENALVGYREAQARLERLMEQARQSARSADLARTRYREGLTDFLDLLDAERTQLGAEDAVAAVEAGVFSSVVDVYKALGGPAAP